jgi:hypothetical protein
MTSVLIAWHAWRVVTEACELTRPFPRLLVRGPNSVAGTAFPGQRRLSYGERAACTIALYAEIQLYGNRRGGQNCQCARLVGHWTDK